MPAADGWSVATVDTSRRRAAWVRRLVVVALSTAALVPMASGCSRRAGNGRSSGGDPGALQLESPAGEPAPRVPFEVRGDSVDLTYFWFDPHGAAHAVTRIDDVPLAARETVRVDSSRPELRAPARVIPTFLGIRARE